MQLKCCSEHIIASGGQQTHREAAGAVLTAVAAKGSLLCPRSFVKSTPASVYSRTPHIVVGQKNNRLIGIKNTLLIRGGVTKLLKQ